jgi:hypothetical protein
VAAFIDVTCRNCGRRFGWIGGAEDAPPCPRCGVRPERDEELERELEALAEDLLAEEEDS